MKKKHMLRRLKLTQESFDHISQAIKTAEEKTTGEIATAITSESASYAFYELYAAILAGFICSILFLPFAHKIRTTIQFFFWDMPEWYLPGLFLIIAAVFCIICYFIANTPAMDRLLVPRIVRRTLVTNRALRYFTESGIYNTKDRTGILIFVSYMEREVRIVADTGINEKISQGLWNIIADEMADTISRGKTEEAFVTAIQQCADLLQTHFPSSDQNPDELTDNLTILEDERWN